MSFPLAANTVDAAALADELARFRVVDPARLTELLAEFPGGGPDALAGFLVQRGALTPFQADRALSGEARILALGPYRLTGSAGRGTFGPLYSAVHTSKAGTFNVRVLPLRSLWRARQAKQLARTLGSNVKHPAVSPLLEVDSANGFHYLVWSAAEGERLADRVNASGPLSAGAAAALLGHLANALGACHARNVVHGVLTPRSVAIAPGGLPLLLELGAGALLAQNVSEDESLFDSMSAASASAASLTFAAPELAANPHLPTTACDQYALGAVGYFAVTGLQPYPHPTLAEQLRAKRGGPPPSAAIVNPAIPEELAAVLERMMEPNPAARFATLAQVEEQLAALATHEPTAPAEQPVVESLLLSRLHANREGSGAISWSNTGSGIVRPPQRDDSEASVTFDLPDAPETVPNATEQAPAGRASVETPPGLSLATRPEPTATPAPFLIAAQPAAPPPPAPPAPPAASPPRVQPPDSKAGEPSSDPRLTAPTPVLWHPTDAEDGPAAEPAPGVAEPPNSVLWKKVKRNLLFWQAASDVIQVSVYGPAAVTPGQTAPLAVFLHTPEAAAGVRTLSRAFHPDAELVGTGYLTREVARSTELAVHLSVANAGVSKTLLKFQWRGQPHRLTFDLHVPWESPEGSSPGLVSVGLNNFRVGRIEFRLHVLPRKA